MGYDLEVVDGMYAGRVRLGHDGLFDVPRRIGRQFLRFEKLVVRFDEQLAGRLLSRGPALLGNWLGRHGGWYCVSQDESHATGL